VQGWGNGNEESSPRDVVIGAKNMAAWVRGIPSGYVKIAIENGDLVRGFSH